MISENHLKFKEKFMRNPLFKPKKLVMISLCIGMIVLMHFDANKSWAGPNEQAGCALDLDISTREYDSAISSKDIEQYIQADANELITVGLVAQNVTNLDTYEVILEYDTDHMTFVNGYEDSPMMGIKNILKSNKGTTIGFQASEATLGIINISNSLTYSKTEEAPEGSGLMALLQFRILDQSSCNKIDIVQATYKDSLEIYDNLSKKMHAYINGSAQACIEPQNTPPVISSISDRSTKERFLKAYFTIDDTETPSDQLLLSATSSNQNLVQNDQLVFSGSDFSRTIIITPLNGQYGDTSISITVTDLEGLTSASSFVVSFEQKISPTISGSILMNGNSINDSSSLKVHVLVNNIHTQASVDESGQFSIEIDHPDEKQFTIIAAKPGYYGRQQIDQSLPITDITINMTPLTADSHQVIVDSLGGASFNVKDSDGLDINNASVEIPVGSITTSSDSIIFSYTRWENDFSDYFSGSTEDLIEIHLNENHSEINEKGIYMTIPIDASINEKELKDGDYVIYHAPSIGDLMSGDNLIKVNPNDIINVESGAVTFKTSSLSVFAVAPKSVSYVPPPEGNDSGGCFISTFSVMHHSMPSGFMLIYLSICLCFFVKRIVRNISG